MMPRILSLLLALLIGVAPVYAADNTVILTPGTGVTMRSKDVGSGVEAMMPVLGDTSGNALATAPGAGNAVFALPMQGVAGGIAVPIAAPSGAVASGAYASGSISDGAVVTLGAKADAKNAATDTTAISVMSVLKEISSLEQAPASRAVTNAGTFATQSAITAASGALASGSIAAGAISAGAYVSGSVLSGAYASGSLASGAVVDLTNIEGVIGNATSPTKMAVTGCVYNSGGVTLTSGQSAAKQCTAGGSEHVTVDNTNTNGQAIAANSSPVVEPVLTNGGAAVVKGGVAVVNGGSNYQEVAASQTATVLQTSTGAAGDYLSHCVIYPATTGAGLVTVFDSTNSAANNVIQFVSGTLSNLAPIAVPVGANSVNGAWKVTTGANVAVVCYGKFS